MPDNEKFKIQLRVSDKVYPMFCKRSDEGLFRKAATNVNDMILRYSSQLSGAKLELKDLLVMVAVHFSAENLLLKKKEDTSPLFDSIDVLNNELEEYLKTE